jgi:HEAT repeat protein
MQPRGSLGWIRNPSNRAVRALIHALTDVSQPASVRETAVESLAYLRSGHSIPALVSVPADFDVRIRFWAVFALGSIRKYHTDRSIIPALEAMLADHAVPPGSWCLATREAMSMLGELSPPEASHRGSDPPRSFGALYAVPTHYRKTVNGPDSSNTASLQL